MSSANLGYTFYHDEVGNALIDYGRSIVGQSAGADLQHDHFAIAGARAVSFKVLYPGLLFGIGYCHPRPANSNDDYALGFSFDHTTGMPCLPGSSVKGVLRSAFPQNDKDERIGFINEILGEKLEYARISQFEQEIFGERPANTRTTSSHTQDIFYDGYISRFSSRLFQEESITPHDDSLIKDPKPIKLLKVAPDTEITLQFLFSDAENCLQLDWRQRLQLYSEIILWFGLGAKTKLGFGQFDAAFTANQLQAIKKEIEHQKQAKLKEIERQQQAKLAEAKERRLRELPLPEQIFDQFNGNIPEIVNHLKTAPAALSPEDRTAIAQMLKKKLIEDKAWSGLKKQQKKQLERVNYIKSILGEAT